MYTSMLSRIQAVERQVRQHTTTSTPVPTERRRSKESRDREGDNRSTAELILVLGKDFERLQQRMVTSAKRGHLTEADASHARNLVRALFAYIEGALFVMKTDALFVAEDNGVDLSFPEHALAFEQRFELNDRGEMAQRSAHIPLERNIRFALNLYAKAVRAASPVDTNSDWWRALRRSIGLRDRLTHPRHPADLDIGPAEIIDAVAAKIGFMESLSVLLDQKEQIKTRATTHPTQA